MINSCITSVKNTQEEETRAQDDDHDLAKMRIAIADGLAKLPYQVRNLIEEEVHGVKSMGLSQEEESKPRIQALFLNKFKLALNTMLSASVASAVTDAGIAVTDSGTPEGAPSSSSSESLPSLSHSSLSPQSITAAYELCLRKNYAYATNENGELRLMCLRADLWDPEKACNRFLRHLTALYKYYGDDGLKQPLTIDHLDYEECHGTKSSDAILNHSGATRGKRKTNPNEEQRGRRRSPSSSSGRGAEPGVSSSSPSLGGGSRGIYKKGKGGSKRKGSLDSLPDMMALKSGSIQVLPSRDRSGRRVIVLQPGPSVTTSTQQTKQVQHSKIKSMLYFLCAVLWSDVDAQRKGIVLILNSTKTDEKYDGNNETIDYETNAGDDLLYQYKELCQSVPVRFSSVHFAFDNDSKMSSSHRIATTILQSFIDNNPTTNIARIHLYDQDVSNDSTKKKIAPFGIPTHQIPVTHTGTIKLKEHNGWVKIQEWYGKELKKEASCCKLNVIACPGTNDVLFSQGGKYWNGVNRFQRGNLEFMEFLESKIDIYQSTLSWKKKHNILSEVVTEFATALQNSGSSPARFLETATQIEGVTAPDGCWVELPLTSPLLMQKIRQTLLNHIRRLENSGKRKPAPSKAVRVKKKGTKKKKQPDKKDDSNNKESEVHVGSKKRKIAQDDFTRAKQMQLNSPHSVMKNNKLAIATFGSSITSNSITKHMHSNESLLHKQSICEFLANAERIAVSTAAVDIARDDNLKNSNLTACDVVDHGNDLHDSIANDEKLVQAIIANDDRLNKEVGELFEMDSFLRDDDEDGGNGERDEIADCLMGCML